MKGEANKHQPFHTEVFGSLKQILEFFPDDRAKDSFYFLIIRLYYLEVLLRCARDFVRWDGVAGAALRRDLKEAVAMLDRKDFTGD